MRACSPCARRSVVLSSPRQLGWLRGSHLITLLDALVSSPPARSHMSPRAQRCLDNLAAHIQSKRSRPPCPRQSFSLLGTAVSSFFSPPTLLFRQSTHSRHCVWSFADFGLRPIIEPDALHAHYYIHSLHSQTLLDLTLVSITSFHPHAFNMHASRFLAAVALSFAALSAAHDVMVGQEHPKCTPMALIEDAANGYLYRHSHRRA